ncbi:MAG: cyclic nucleotide-binding domain-containing protein [Bdellovibrionota bacterium]
MNYLWDNIFKRTRREADVHSVLRENILFEDLTDRELRFVESIIHVRRFHAGEPVFRQGEIGVGMYLLIKGRVEIFVSDTFAETDETREIFITQLTAGDFFGELALVEDNGRRTASAIARDESVMVGFFKPDLMEILSRSPAAGIKITLRLAEVLGRRLKETTEKVSELRQALKELREPPPLEPGDGR